MPEVIYCPSGGHKLRVADEMLGQVVQCPICGLVFTAPTRGPAGPPVPPPRKLPAVLPSRPPEWNWAGRRPQDARSALMGPATALLLVSVFTVLLALINAVVYSMNPAEAKQLSDLVRNWTGRDPGATAPQLITYCLVLAVLNILIILAAVQMLRLRTYPLAIMGSILALVSCAFPCCLVGFPLGIWTLTVLNRPDVREAFR